MHLTYIQMGSNLGERFDYLTQAKELIATQIGPIVSQSDIFESEPWGFFTANWFLNQVIAVNTSMSPNEILITTQNIELVLGRKREGKSYSSRTIDIDLLLIDNLIINSEALTIPHPHLHERLFVLKPLAQIAPNTLHPTLGKSITSLLEECKDDLEVAPWPKKNREKRTRSCRL